MQIGQNEIVFMVDFYENPDVHYAIYGDNVTESLVNMMSYDTVIEPIFLQGKFCVNESLELSPFVLPKNLNGLQKQGFPYHYKGMQEDLGVCPYMFTLFRQWRNGQPNDF